MPAAFVHRKEKVQPRFGPGSGLPVFHARRDVAVRRTVGVEPVVRSVTAAFLDDVLTAAAYPDKPASASGSSRIAPRMPVYFCI
ncbi:hypothetical protein WS57_25085 [Burkholderia pseudomultivorans]|nr:hypothetical protein WS57_25085 [Burkholderia pseudomultivorans]